MSYAGLEKTDREKLIEGKLYIVDEILNSMTVVKDTTMLEDLRSEGVLVLIDYINKGFEKPKFVFKKSRVVDLIKRRMEKYFCESCNISQFPQSEEDIYKSGINKISNEVPMSDAELDVLYKHGYVTNIDANELDRLSVDDVVHYRIIIEDSKKIISDLCNKIAKRDVRLSKCVKAYYDCIFTTGGTIPLEDIAYKYKVGCSRLYSELQRTRIDLKVRLYKKYKAGWNFLEL